MRYWLFILLSLTFSSPEDMRLPQPIFYSSPADNSRLAFDDTIPDLLLELVNKKIKGKIDPGGFSYEAPSTVILDDVVLKGPAGKVIARAERLVADVRIRSLFSGDIFLDSLTVSKASLSLRQKDGVLNLIEAFSPKKKTKQATNDSSSPKSQIRIQSILLAEGTLNYVHESGFELNIDGIRANASLDIDLESQWVSLSGNNVKARTGLLHWPDFDLPLKDLRANNVKFYGNRVDFSDVTGTCLGSAVSGFGNIRFKNKGAYNIHAQVDIPKGTWPLRLKPLEFAAPAFKGQVKVNGSLKKPITTVEGQTGSFTAYDYPVRKADLKLKIDLDRLHFKKTVLYLSTGSIKSTGSYAYEERWLSLSSSVSNVKLAELLIPAELKETPRGTINGSVKTNGTISPSVSLQVSGDIRGSRLTGYGLKPAGQLHVIAGLKVRDQSITIQKLDVSSKKLNLTGEGTIWTKEKRLKLDLASRILDVGTIYPKIPDELHIDTMEIRSRVTGSFSNLRGEGVLTSQGIRAWGVDIPTLETDLLFDSDYIVGEAIQAQIQNGAAQGNIRIALEKGAEEIEGQLSVANIVLNGFKPPGKETIPISGQANGDLRIRGPLDQPTVFADIVGRDLEYDGILIGSVSTEATITGDRLSLRRTTVRNPYAVANARFFQVRFSDLSLQGRLMVRNLDMRHPIFPKELDLAGQLSGPVLVTGTAKRPRIRSRSQIKSLQIKGAAFDHGQANIYLFTQEHETEMDTVVQVTGVLGRGEGQISFRTGLFLEREKVNAEVQIEDMDLQSWLETWDPSYPSPDGLLKGNVSVKGDWSNPSIWLTADTPLLTLVPALNQTNDVLQNVSLSTAYGSQGVNVSVRASDTTYSNHSSALKKYQTLGPAQIQGQYMNGMVDLLLCAFPKLAADEELSPCQGNESFWLSMSGPFALDQETMDLDIEGMLKDEALEKYIPALANQGIELSGKISGHINLAKEKNRSTLDRSGLLQLHDLVMESDGSPTIRLKESGFIHINQGIIAPEESLAFEIKEKEVRMQGLIDLDRKNLNIGIDGELAFSIIQIFTPEITQATGTADTLLTLTGSFEGPSLDGCLSPNPGAALTFRSLGRSVDLKEGSFCFNADPRNRGTQKLEANNLVCGLDDGQATFNGQFSFLIDENENNRVTFFDWGLKATGTNLRFRSDRTYVESAFDLSLTSQDETPLLKGRIEVTDGKAQESFAFKNFILTKETTDSESRIIDALSVVNLENVEFDVEVAIQNTDLRIDLAQFRIDGNIQGDLHLGSSARLPDLSGAIDVTEGQVRFPYAIFEVEQSQIEFPKRSDGRIVPRIYVSAVSELDANRNGLGVEIPATLEFEGDSNKLALNMRADDAPQKISETDLLKFVLFGKPLQSDQFLAADPDAALRALSSELTLAFTRDLEDAVENQFGTDIQFNLFAESSRVGGGIRYQLGDRVEFEGETGFLAFGDNSAATEDEEENVSAAEARVRLLVVDHLPSYLGEELAIEGEVTSGGASGTSSGSANGDLRFTYRIFSF